MERTYKTTQVANIIGIHPNTVRLYETLGLISAPIRLPNGYRVFTELHVEQFELARTAFQVEVLQNGLRKKMTSIIKLSAKLEFEKAIELTQSYIKQIQLEQKNAEEAIRMAEQLLAHSPEVINQTKVKTRQEVSDYLGISMDTLRNWEMNGLLEVKRKRNGYRIYTESDIMRLKIIRSLRCANYSLSAILRMMNALTEGKPVDLRKMINTPQEDETIISVCDKLLTSLEAAKVNAQHMQKQLQSMKKKYS
jgi:DNA-binding transcriptional MerR regulator